MTAIKGMLSVAIDPDDQLLDSRGMQAARIAIGDAAYREAFAAGKAWDPEQAIAAALAACA